MEDTKNEELPVNSESSSKIVVPNEAENVSQTNLSPENDQLAVNNAPVEQTGMVFDQESVPVEPVSVDVIPESVPAEPVSADVIPESMSVEPAASAEDSGVPETASVQDFDEPKTFPAESYGGSKKTEEVPGEQNSIGLASEVNQTDQTVIVENASDTAPLDAFLPLTTPSAQENTPEYPQNANQGSKFNFTENVIRVLFIVLVALLVFWVVHRNNKIAENNYSDDLSNVVVSVDDTAKQGKVTIAEDNGDRFIGKNMPEGLVVGTIGAGTSTSNVVAVTSSYKITAFYPKSGGACGQVAALQRSAEKKYTSDLVNAIRTMIMPLSATERAQGFSTAIPAGTMLKSIKIIGSTAVIHFNDNIKANNACVVSTIKSQVERTAKQFSYIKLVTICASDNCDQGQIWQ